MYSQKNHAFLNVTIGSLQYENLESFLIPLEDITLAARNFNSENYIEMYGDYAVVYRGQLSKQWQNRIAAFKRFHHQDKDEFLITELKMMSIFHHENIIRYIGYCDQGKEMIIFSEFNSNYSLEDHLQDPNNSSCLTWARRMNICMGAVRGLNYLNSCLGENRVVIHRNVNSSTILLDENLDTKICGFGISLLVVPDQISQNSTELLRVAH